MNIFFITSIYQYKWLYNISSEHAMFYLIIPLLLDS